MNIEEAKSILQSQGLLLKESSLDEYDPLVYTGLPYGDGTYAGIISSVPGQITDGIGEGSGRTSGIFRHYFEHLDYVRAKNVNGELAVDVSKDDLPDLIKCIWRIASIEREDNNTENRNMYYDYLRTDWRDICKLQAALKKIVEKGGKTEPWSEERKSAHEERAERFRERARAKAEAEAKAKAEAEAKAREKVENSIKSILSSYEPDAKDLDRATAAWDRARNTSIGWDSGTIKDTVVKFIRYYREQRDKIKDPEKSKRRAVAFYNKFMEKDPDNKSNYKDRWEYYLLSA